MVASGTELADHSRDSVARRLAESHFRVDPGIVRIFRLVRRGQEDDQTEPIKLLEVNRETAMTGIQPIRFGPHPASGTCYPSIIVEVRPEEFELIVEGKLALPDGWVLGPEYTASENGQ